MLQQTKDSVLEQLGTIGSPSTLSGNDFELIVYENAVLHANETQFEGKLRHTDDREFPDIIAADFFGIEVKATKKDDWTSIGNSVLESSRVKTVEKIYMFFGKLGGSPDIMFRNYEECLKGIAVTHYPRYQIDMKLKSEDSIFSKMGTDYDTIRNSNNPVTQIRTYYRQQLKEGEGLWWIDDDIEREAPLSPVIKNFVSLDATDKDTIKADIFIRFPEVFTNSSKKFEKVPAFLAAKYGVVTANLRDNFTAGGQITIKYRGEEYRLPQITKELCRLAEQISTALEQTDEVMLSNSWQKKIVNFENAEQAWMNELDKITADMDYGVRLSELYSSAKSGEVKV